jgi:hypothetical protein
MRAGADEDDLAGLAAVVDPAGEQDVAAGVAFAMSDPVALQRVVAPFGPERAVIGDQVQHRLLEAMHVVAPERDSRSQSFANDREKLEARGSGARLSLAGLFKFREQFVSRLKPRAVLSGYLIRFRHRCAGFGVRHPELERKGLVGDHALQEEAHGVGDGQAQGVQRGGRLLLGVVVDADVEHGGAGGHIHDGIDGKCGDVGGEAA